MVMSSMQRRCKSSPGSFDNCRRADLRSKPIGCWTAWNAAIMSITSTTTAAAAVTRNSSYALSIKKKHYIIRKYRRSQWKRQDAFAGEIVYNFLHQSRWKAPKAVVRVNKQMKALIMCTINTIHWLFCQLIMSLTAMEAGRQNLQDQTLQRPMKCCTQ